MPLGAAQICRPVPGCTLRMIECPQIEDHEGSEAGIRVVPRVIARPFFGDEFFYVKNLVREQERKRSDERKAAEHQG